MNSRTEITAEERARILAELKTEKEGEKEFARVHQVSYTAHRSEHSGKITMRQWMYARGNRACLVTRFPGYKTGWFVSERTNDGPWGDTSCFSTQEVAIFDVVNFLKRATVLEQKP